MAGSPFQSCHFHLIMENPFFFPSLSTSALSMMAQPFNHCRDPIHIRAVSGPHQSAVSLPLPYSPAASQNRAADQEDRSVLVCSQEVSHSLHLSLKRLQSSLPPSLLSPSTILRSLSNFSQFFPHWWSYRGKSLSGSCALCFRGPPSVKIIQ